MAGAEVTFEYLHIEQVETHLLSDNSLSHLQMRHISRWDCESRKLQQERPFYTYQDLSAVLCIGLYSIWIATTESRSECCPLYWSVFYMDCYNRIPQTGVIYSEKRFIWLLILKIGKSKSTTPASREGLCSGPQHGGGASMCLRERMRGQTCFPNN